MIYSKNPFLAFAFSLVLILTSCAPQMEEVKTAKNPQLNQVVSSQTFHALMPNSTQDVYQMDLTVFADGTSEAVRTVVSYNSSYDYGDLFVVGESSLTEGLSGVDIEFDRDVWFIPFDGQSGPPMQAIRTVQAGCGCVQVGPTPVSQTLLLEGCTTEVRSISNGWRLSCGIGVCNSRCVIAQSCSIGPGGGVGVLVASDAVAVS